MPTPMESFSDLKLSKHLLSALEDLGYDKPTPIQQQSFSTIMAGKDIVGIAQTGTGKTFAYLLPLLQDLKFSKEVPPRIIILVPTRELVLQVIENINLLTTYKTVRAVGVYGGTNIKTQKLTVLAGADIVVGTPGRLYDLALSGALSLKFAKKLVIDEVDVMLDLGFRFQLTNIFELLPDRRQNIMLSATMTDHVDELIDDFFVLPAKISIAVSGTPLENITQSCYSVPNYYTKAHLLTYLMQDKEEYSKVLVFLASKKSTDRLYDYLSEELESEMAVVHSNKSQNYRIRSIKQFEEGSKRILLTTDVMARGIDLDAISHVINFDTPAFPENYMHRIGRTGRAEHEGKSILFSSPMEADYKASIEELMNYIIPELPLPEGIEISDKLVPEERPKLKYAKRHDRNEKQKGELPKGFHEKKDKNKKENQGGKYRRELAKKYKKSQSRGDKIQNMASKRRKKKK